MPTPTMRSITGCAEQIRGQRPLSNPLQRGRPEKRLFLLGAVLLLGACKGQNTADSVAERFVDAYYIEFNHAKAMKLTIGPAKRRLEREIELVKTARKELRVEPNKARVYYSSPERRALDKTRVHYKFNLDIRKGVSAFGRPVSVMVAIRDGQWKVLGFRELDAVAPGQRGNEVVGTSTSP